jgi:hypothetical protein
VPSVIADVGHSAMQLPQPMHSLAIKCGISKNLLDYSSTIDSNESQPYLQLKAVYLYAHTLLAQADYARLSLEK